jgi:hypothetical protein
MHSVIRLAAVSALCLLGAASTATAAPTVGSSYVYSHSFAEEGQIAGPSGTTGIAVEPGTGNLLVADTNGAGVTVFAPGSGPADPPLTKFDGGALPSVVASDPASGAIYVQDSIFSSLTRWTSDGAPVPTYALDSSYEPEVSDHRGGIAVDPTTSDLLVVEPGSNQVVRLDAAGERLSSFPVKAETRFGEVVGIAVDSEGKIYAADENYGDGSNVVSQYTATGERLGKLAVVGSAHNVALDPASGGVAVVADRSGSFWIEGFDSTGERVFETPFPELPEQTASVGLALNSENGRLYALTGGFGPVPAIRVFDPVPSPGAEAPTVSAITTDSAHVSAEVNPGAGPPAGSFAYFEYSGDGGKTWNATPTQEPSAAGPVEADLTGLASNLEYLVRVVVGNELTRHNTTTTSFTTFPIAPATVTGAATDVGETSAVINGTIDPAGLQATYHFEYGLTSSYGSRVPATIEAVAGNGRAPRIFSRTLTGLQPGTTYHYRLVAENSIGVSEGEDRTFTTLSPGAIAPRAYEQVTPVDKLGGTIDPNLGFQAAEDGSAISYFVRSPGGAKGSPLFARFFARRGSNDWEGGIPLDPPLNVVRTTVFITTLAVSDDSSHAFVMSNRKLTPGGIENGANFYLEDIETGEYTLVAASEAAGVFSAFTTLLSQNKFLYGSPDFSTLIFGSPIPLLPGVNGTAHYRWTAASGLELETVMPDGTAPLGEADLPLPAGELRYVSADASRSYFTISGGSQDGIYLRENGQTRPISVSRRAGDPDTPQAGLFMGTNEDGRYAFFFTYSGQLTEDAPPQEGDIYRYDAVEDELEYIGAQAGPGVTPSNVARVAVSDDGETFYFAGRNGLEVWRNGTVHLIKGSPRPIAGTGFASPSGRYLAFAGFKEPVYLYDAVTEELTCASCLSDGTDPGGANLPVAETQASNQIPDAVTDQGEVFFDTTARLVAADVNGVSDAYALKGGRARLISPGNAPFPAYFGDISAGGNDVFFTTAQKLVGRDEDRSVDIYDARIGGGFPVQNPPPPQECLRDDCKATPNAGPELPFGGSEALSGPGNVKPKKARRCGKGRHLRRLKGKSRCVKTHHKKAQHKKANSNRRQAR